VLYRLVNRDGRTTKVPYCIDGRAASSTDPATWGIFDDVVAAFKAGGFDGIGFVFTADDDLAGIDLDHCRDPETGTIEPWAQAIINMFPGAYVEISQSGTGVHLIVRAKLPEKFPNKRTGLGGEGKGAIEVYDRARYFVMTGNCIGPVLQAIGETTLAGVLAMLTKPPLSTRKPAVHKAGTDAELIEHAKAADPGFVQLWAGDTSGFDHDDSKADFAFCCKLARLGADAEQIARLFRQSGLMRDKWDRDDYREGTIRNAIDTCAATASIVWPDPKPLPSGLPPVLPFDYELLPKVLADWIRDIADRMQCSPDYLVAALLVMAGALIGRQIGIRPKRQDNWTVVPNLYGGGVGNPSVMKSPAAREVMKFPQRLEAEAAKAYAKAVEEHAAAELVSKATQKVKGESLRAAVKKGGNAAAIAHEMIVDEPDPPRRKRYILNDSTVEKLGEILSENSNGVQIFLDELVSLLRTMDREGHEADRGFYLTAWEGNSRYTYDRIGRGTVEIEAAIVSIFGLTQPGVWADYLRGAIHGGVGADGLVQRFQVMVWPDTPGNWQNVDRFPDAVARDAAYAALQSLVCIPPGAVKEELDPFEPVPFLRFDDAAQAVFDVWRADLEARLRTGEEHPVMEAHLAKYRSLMPSIALILHLLDGGGGAVPLVAADRAIRWCRYLESHARRLYASVIEAPAVAAQLLARRIEKGDITDSFAARDVYRMGWAGMDRDQTAAAIDVLLTLHWIEERSEPTAGRDRTRYAINPKITKHLRTELTKPTEGS
jgi:putative DNA primase/helicase